MLLAYAIAVTVVAALLLVAQCRTWEERDEALRERDQARTEAEGWQLLHDRAQHGWLTANEANRRLLPEPYRFGLGFVRDLQRVAEDEEAN